MLRWRNSSCRRWHLTLHAEEFQLSCSKYNIFLSERSASYQTYDGLHFDRLYCLYAYQAKNNDSSILNSQLEAETDFVRWIEQGDCLILDRGFRDCQAVLAQLNIDAKIPSYISSGRKQFFTDQANQTSLVTSCSCAWQDQILQILC